jgi:Probable cobalt transporter subunit (CbtB)
MGREIPGDIVMTNATSFAPTAQPVAIPIREVLLWAIFGGLLLMLAIYFVGAEGGATSLIKGMYVHEFVHDGRHLLGFPCH